MNRTYYPINEETARRAQEVNSFREYSAGSATAIYKKYCNVAYDLVDKIQEEKPTLYEKACTIAERYCKKLATYYNDYYRNEASCPSVMICGPANFPVKKKQRQNSRRDTLQQVWIDLEKYPERLHTMLTHEQTINSADSTAIEQLKAKIDALEAEKESMKTINAYYRKHGTLEGYPVEFTESEKSHIAFIFRMNLQNYGLFDTANINQQIRATKDRLQKLESVKESGTKETETDFFKIVENTETMRLQLFFDGKPDENTRNILKKNGFKWAPSQNAWQRQLTPNAKCALKQIISALS